MKTSYHIDPYSIQPNNMHILQVNPSVAINLGDGDDYGWLFEAEAERQEDWVKIRKLSGRDLDAAKDQVADMGVLDAGGALPASVAKKEEPAPRCPIHKKSCWPSCSGAGQKRRRAS